MIEEKKMEDLKKKMKELASVVGLSSEEVMDKVRVVLGNPGLNAYSGAVKFELALKTVFHQEQRKKIREERTKGEVYKTLIPLGMSGLIFTSTKRIIREVIFGVKNADDVSFITSKNVFDEDTLFLKNIRFLVSRKDVSINEYLNSLEKGVVIEETLRLEDIIEMFQIPVVPSLSEIQNYLTPKGERGFINNTQLRVVKGYIETCREITSKKNNRKFYYYELIDPSLPFEEEDELPTSIRAWIPEEFYTERTEEDITILGTIVSNDEYGVSVNAFNIK